MFKYLIYILLLNNIYSLEINIDDPQYNSDVQTGVNTIADQGGVINFSAKIYPIHSQIKINGSSSATLTLKGPSKENPAILSNSYCGEDDLVFIERKNVVLENLEIRETNCESEAGSPNYATVKITNTNGVKITNSRIHGSRKMAVFILKASDNIISYNSIKDSKVYGILVTGRGSDRNLIEGNEIERVGTYNGVYIGAHSGSYVPRHCYAKPTPEGCLNSNEELISVCPVIDSDTFFYVENNIVRGNFIDDIDDTDIETGINSKGTIIEGNTTKVDKNPGILMRDAVEITVRKNKIIGDESVSNHLVSVIKQCVNPGYGIKYVTNNVIEDNRIEGKIYSSGIYIGQSSVTVKNNFIKNTSRNYSTPDYGKDLKDNETHGILIEANNVEINNNYIEGVAFGINLYDKWTVEGAKVVYNTIKNTRKSIDLWKQESKSSLFQYNNIGIGIECGIEIRYGIGHSSTSFLTNVFSSSDLEIQGKSLCNAYSQGFEYNPSGSMPYVGEKTTIKRVQVYVIGNENVAVVEIDRGYGVDHVGFVLNGKSKKIMYETLKTAQESGKSVVMYFRKHEKIFVRFLEGVGGGFNKSGYIDMLEAVEL